MRRFLLPLSVALLLVPAPFVAALAQSSVPAIPPVSSSAPTTPAPTSLTLTAPVGTVREYRGNEVTRVTFTGGDFVLTGVPEAEAQDAQAQFLAALKSRSGETVQPFKQFVKVLPAAGTPGKLLYTSILTDEGQEPLTLRSVRTLGASATLAFQPDESPENADPLAGILGNLNTLLAALHADLIANFDPAAFGILGKPLTPGTVFTRTKTLKPNNPLAGLGTGNRETQAISVEQQLRFEGVQGGLLVFSRAARIVQGQQIVTGQSANLTTTLSSYTLTGELRVTRDGLPVSATRTESYAAEVKGKLTAPEGQDAGEANFSLQLGGSSVLTLTSVR
ncbi:hypothetical protein [Deinococcus puniceus]|uniref:Uncharacterized protein n=1 Tax=Deinococcus puniceus TaxID=1182568 RepID=A0A172T6I7_9DEIO|nr:hypothetical protein [Deinococcus puniceus]ANE42655.1 hypothetical protein SU48_01515 [Deinococcus puniceus]